MNEQELVAQWALYRVALFSGLLTIGGILFTITSFLLTNLTKEMYGTDDYLKTVSSRLSQGGKVTIFGPLLRLKKCLFHGIWACLMASIVVLVVGFMNVGVWGILICVTFVLYGIFRLILAIYRFWFSLKDFLEYKESLGMKKIQEGLK